MVPVDQCYHISAWPNNPSHRRHDARRRGGCLSLLSHGKASHRRLSRRRWRGGDPASLKNGGSQVVRVEHVDQRGRIGDHRCGVGPQCCTIAGGWCIPSHARECTAAYVLSPLEKALPSRFECTLEAERKTSVLRREIGIGVVKSRGHFARARTRRAKNSATPIPISELERCSQPPRQSGRSGPPQTQ